MTKLILSIILLLLSLPQEFTAKVIKIIDVDTIFVLTSDNQQIKIRLEGIDCPESKQDFGQKAKQVTADLCFGKQVLIKETGKDRYGRTLAFVYSGDRCINKELIKMGMAWHYKKYNSDQEMAKLEVKARESKVGLWGQGQPVALWEWKARK